MKARNVPRSRLAARKATFAALALAAAAIAIPGTVAAAQGPIRIGVIASATFPLGKPILQGATLAAQEINAAGGIGGRRFELFEYDDHRSATDAVRAFQRAVKQDHVVAVVGVFFTEVALALQPWAARLHVPFITTGAASPGITANVHKNYRRNKYTFQEWLNSAFMAQSVCDFSKDELVPRGIDTAVIMSEDAAYSIPLDAAYLRCLPRAGMKVLAHIRFAPTTTDYTPIYNEIEALHPAVIVTGWGHVGVKPVVQWHDQRVPALVVGINGQADSNAFWKATNGDTAGVIAQTAVAPGQAITPKSVPFTNAYHKRFGVTPAYDAYTTDDALHVLKAAIERAHSTAPGALVAALEKTNYVGTMGRVQYFGRRSKYAHGTKYGKNYLPAAMLQWQHGKQVAIWRANSATGSLVLPRDFVENHRK